MALLLKNGRLVDPSIGLDVVADIVIRDGIIVEVGEGLSIPKGVVKDCAGKAVFPGIRGHARPPARTRPRRQRDHRIRNAGGRPWRVHRGVSDA